MFYSAPTWAIITFWLLAILSAALDLWRAKSTAPARPLSTFPQALAALADFPLCFLLATAGLIAFHGYDGILFAIAFFAGILTARFAFAGRLAWMHNQSLAGALGTRFQSHAVRQFAAITTLIVCFLLLAAEILTAAALLRPMLGGYTGMLQILTAALVLIAPAVLANIASAKTAPVAAPSSEPRAGTHTPAKKSLLANPSLTAYILASALVALLLALAFGITRTPLKKSPALPRVLSTAQFRSQLAPSDIILPEADQWAGLHFARVRHRDESITIWRYTGTDRISLQWDAAVFYECHEVLDNTHGQRLIDGHEGTLSDLPPSGGIAALPGQVAPPASNYPFADNAQPQPNPANPLAFLTTLQESVLTLPRQQRIVDSDGIHTIYLPTFVYGEDYFTPGSTPNLFPRLLQGSWRSRLNLLSLFLGIIAGTALLPALLRIPRTGPQLAIASIRIPYSNRTASLATALTAILFLLLILIATGAAARGRLDPANSTATTSLAAAALGAPFLILFTLTTIALLTLTARKLLRATAQALTDSRRIQHPPTPELPISDQKSQISNLKSEISNPNPQTQNATPQHSSLILHPSSLTLCLLALTAAILAIVLAHISPAAIAAWALAIAAASLLPVYLLSDWLADSPRAATRSIALGYFISAALILTTPDAYTAIFGIGTAESLRAPAPLTQPAIIALPISMLVLLAARLFPRTNR